MKLKVVGWTYYDDSRFPEEEVSFAAHAAIVEEIRANGYRFSGEEHQERDNCTPVLSDGKMRCYSQRGWGNVMAEAYGHTDPLDYALYAFRVYEDTCYPPEEASVYRKLYACAKEVLDEEGYHCLFEKDFTLKFPHPELSDMDIYTLTAEEAECVSAYDTVRQVPTAVCKCLFPKDIAETFILDSAECTICDGYIHLPMQDKYRYLDTGDTVIVGDNAYLVKGVDQYKDVSKKIKSDIMYRSNEGYEEAMKIYKDAPIILKIKI